MTLDFESIVHIANHLKSEKSGKGLQDSEIMALHCTWLRLSYSDFIEDQKKYLSEYAYLYADPSDLKRESTLPACVNRVLQLFRDKYSLGKIKKNQFRRKILELYCLPNSLVNQDFTEILKGYVKVDLTKHEIESSPDDTYENVENNKIIFEQKESFVEQKSKSNELDIENNDKYFIGRKNDYIRIIKFLESKPVILLHGFHGVGKTFFLQKMKSLLENGYKYFYTDFGSLSTFEEWAIQVLSWSGVEYQVESLSLMKSFLDYLETSKSLLIMDSVGKFDNKFNSFIESFAFNYSSSSRIIISSSYKIKLNIPEMYIAQHELHGLRDKQDIFTYMSYLGLKDKESWEEFSKKYSGNFREIKHVAKFIKDFLNGDVSEYLKINTNLMSSDLYSAFSKLNLTEFDRKIFSTFSKGNSGLSKNILDLFRRESSSAELFHRIQFFCDQGYLVASNKEGTDLIYYSLFPLFKNYLIQEELIDA